MLTNDFFIDVKSYVFDMFKNNLPQGVVYHLGDFAFTNTIEQLQEYFQQLNGNIIWVAGNHDKLLFNNDGNLARTKCEKLLTAIPNLARIVDRHTVKVPDEEIDIGHKQKIILFHYPISKWLHHTQGSWHLFGHEHQTMDWKTHWPHAVDVGVNLEHNNFSPYSYQDIKTIITQRAMELKGKHNV